MSRSPGTPGADRRGGWLDDRRTVTWIVYGLYAVCAALLVAELFVHRHVEFDLQGWFGFYAAFGFLAYCGIVAVARVLRRVVRRGEDYYLPPEDGGDREIGDRDGGDRDGGDRDGDRDREGRDG